KRIVRLLVDPCGLNKAQHLRKYRPLAPWTTGVYRELAERYGHGRLDAAPERGEISHAQQATIGFVVGDDRAPKIAGIEGRARRLQPGLAALAQYRPFLINLVLQALCEIALDEQLAHLWRTAIRQIDGAICRPFLIPCAMGCDGFAQQRMR